MAFLSRKTILGCGAAAMAMAMASGALAQQRTFNLPAQEAVKAIPEFARQAGIQIVAPASQLRGVRTPALRGELDTHQALAVLLEGTGLEVASDTGRLITLRQTSAPARAVTRSEPPMASLDEVVVTANKREELLRDVPQSVTAVSERKLDRLQATELQDYAKLVPGLSLLQIAPGQTQVTLRGLSTLSAGSTVGIYVDETPYGSSSGLANGASATTDLNTFDLQRIEVLRGPQGTLYGASTLGGLLKFVTNAPDPSGFSAKVQANAESVDGGFGWATKGMVNLPLGDKAALRITGLHNDNPGYIDDPTRGLEGVNSSRIDALRASLLVDLTDDLSVRLTAVGQNSDYNGSNDVDIVVDPVTGGPRVPFQPLYGDKQQSRDYDETTDIRYRLYNGVLNWNLGWANLVSATSYDTYRQGGLTDLSLLFGVYETTFDKQEKFTQELRLSSPAGQRLEWLAGAYYTHEKAHIGQDYFGVLSGTVRVASTFEEKAAFGTLTYHFTPQFDVAVGGRYARNDQSEVESGTGIGAGLASDNSSSQGVFLYSIAPRWKPNEQTTVYARVASGYRPGGPNLVALGNPNAAPATFDADTVTNYEAGVKTDLLDGRLSLDLSVFDVKWDKIQLLAVINQTTVILNGGSAESKGVEWSATVRPIDRLSLAFSGSYADATLTQGTAPPPPDPDILGGRKGDPLPYQPKWSWTADANYEWPVFDGAQAFVGGSVAYVGERSTDFGEAFGQLRLGGYTTVDLRAGLDLSRWSIELYAKNVGDVRAISQLGSNASTGGGGDPTTLSFGRTMSIVQPRTIGLSVTGRF